MTEFVIQRGMHMMIYRVDDDEESRQAFLATLAEHVKKCWIDWFDAMILSKRANMSFEAFMKTAKDKPA